MKKIFLFLVIILGVKIGFSQNVIQYVPQFVPMTPEQMQMEAHYRALKSIENEKKFDYYSKISIEAGQNGAWLKCIEYGLYAFQTNYVNSQLIFHVGRSYFMTGMKGKWKKQIRLARKHNCLTTVYQLKALK